MLIEPAQAIETWQAAGWKQIAEWVQADIDAGEALAKVSLPKWVFDGPVAKAGGVHAPQGSWSPSQKKFVARSSLPVYGKQLFRAPLAGETSVTGHNGGKTVFEDESVRVNYVLDDIGNPPRIERLEDRVAAIETSLTLLSDGTDLSPQAARIARESYGIPVKVGTLETAGVPDRSMAVITMVHAIERLISLVCYDAGLTIAQTSEIEAQRSPGRADRADERLRHAGDDTARPGCRLAGDRPCR